MARIKKFLVKTLASPALRGKVIVKSGKLFVDKVVTIWLSE